VHRDGDTPRTTPAALAIAMKIVNGTTFDKAAFIQKLASLLKVDSNDLSTQLSASGDSVVVTIQTGDSTTNDQTQQAALSLTTSQLQPLGAADPVKASPPSDPAPAPASGNIGLIAGCAAGGAILLIIIAAVVMKNKAANAAMQDNEQPVLGQWSVELNNNQPRV